MVISADDLVLDDEAFWTDDDESYDDAPDENGELQPLKVRPTAPPSAPSLAAWFETLLNTSTESGSAKTEAWDSIADQDATWTSSDLSARNSTASEFEPITNIGCIEIGDNNTAKPEPNRPKQGYICPWHSPWHSVKRPVRTGTNTACRPTAGYKDTPFAPRTACRTATTPVNTPMRGWAPLGPRYGSARGLHAAAPVRVTRPKMNPKRCRGGTGGNVWLGKRTFWNKKAWEAGEYSSPCVRFQTQRGPIEECAHPASTWEDDRRMAELRAFLKKRFDIDIGHGRGLEPVEAVARFKQRQALKKSQGVERSEIAVRRAKARRWCSHERFSAAVC